jgi:hypothetical protein
MANLRIRRSLMAAAVLAAAVIVCTVSATPALAAENPDGVAVIIGNKTYQGGIPATCPASFAPVYDRVEHLKFATLANFATFGQS